MDFVIRRLTLERPQRPIVLVGMSLGGNVLLKWLGEQGSLLPPQVRAATAVSTPFDLARSCRHIDQTAGRFYSRRFLRSLRRKALEKIARYPSIADADAVRRAESLWEFDNAFTSVVHGFENAADYYSRCSSLGFLNSICVPTLLLSAFDDPFHPPDVLHQVAAIAETNPWLSTEFVDIGGHVGFIEGATPWRTSSYGERRPVEFADTCLSGLRLAGAD